MSAQNGDASIAILVRGLCKSYNGVMALRGLDLDVKRGEIFGFLGPNGSGKTTTIRCLLDAIRPTSGELRVLGFNPQTSPMEVHRRVGYLLGEFAIDDSFTAERALRFFASLRNGVDWGHVGELADRLHLDMGLTIRNMSRGNKQKVSVVQAFMHRPELLLLDEPTSALDPIMQREMLAMVGESQRNGATIFFSSHNLPEVERIADRVGVIRDGVLVGVADPDDLRRRSLRRVHVTFPQPVADDWCADLAGITVASHDTERVNWVLNATGDMTGLLRAAASAGAREIETERPTLEEVFLAYYDTSKVNEDADGARS